jgi:hypothetical protein
MEYTSFSITTEAQESDKQTFLFPVMLARALEKSGFVMELVGLPFRLFDGKETLREISYRALISLGLTLGGHELVSSFCNYDDNYEFL